MKLYSSNNRNITYMGKTQTLAAWSEELGIKYATLYRRIVTKGWEIEDAFTRGRYEQK